MFYRYEHYMSISHMALIVAIVDNFKQFSLVQGRSLNNKTVLFKVIQLIISTQFKCKNSFISSNTI